MKDKAAFRICIYTHIYIYRCENEYMKIYTHTYIHICINCFQIYIRFWHVDIFSIRELHPVWLFEFHQIELKKT